VSENIRVVSIVGRFLEHSRIFSFERPDETRIFIGSADLMPRNLYNRVELVSPVEDPANRDQLTDVLDRAFADNTNAWELGGDGVWSRLTTNGDSPRSLQGELLNRHAERAEAAAGTAV
jgi:polyphosphate kinase